MALSILRDQALAEREDAERCKDFHATRLFCVRASSLCALPLLPVFRVMEHAKPKQIEVSTTIHTPFNQFEPIDVSLDWAITKGKS